MKNSNICYLLLAVLFTGCFKDRGDVHMKIHVKENFTNNPLDSFQFHFSDQRCAYLGLGYFCLDPILKMTDEDGNLDFKFDQCCKSEMTIYEFANSNYYADRFDVEISEVNSLDTIESCNGILITSDTDYDFTIIVKPYVYLQIRTEDTSFVSFDLPEYDIYNATLNNDYKINDYKIFVHQLKGTFEFNLNKQDMSKIKYIHPFDSTKRSIIKINYK